MWRYACKDKHRQTNGQKIVECIWSASQPVVSPVQGCTRSCCGNQADLPDGILGICGMTFRSMGTWGGTKSLCKQQAGSSDVGGPPGTGSRMRCPSLCGCADAPHTCQAFSFIRPRSDTYRGEQPEAIIAASLQCGHAHTHTHIHINSVTYTDKVTFGIIF